MGVSDVAENGESVERFWGQFHGPNSGYLEQQYELYREDPEAVEPSIKEMFDKYGAPAWMYQQENAGQSVSQKTLASSVKKLTSAMQLVEAIRRYGHTEADIYSIGGYKGSKTN